MSIFNRWLGRAHRKASLADREGQSEKSAQEREKTSLEKRIKRVEATVRAYGIDRPKKEST